MQSAHRLDALFPLALLSRCIARGVQPFGSYRKRFDRIPTEDRMDSLVGRRTQQAKVVVKEIRGLHQSFIPRKKNDILPVNRKLGTIEFPSGKTDSSTCPLKESAPRLLDRVRFCLQIRARKILKGAPLQKPPLSAFGFKKRTTSVVVVPTFRNAEKYKMFFIISGEESFYGVCPGRSPTKKRRVVII